MGQYKQWRQHRETDQRLHSQLSRLSSDLISLQAQEQQLEQNLSLADNSIIHSLFAQLLPTSLPSAQEPKAETTPGLTAKIEVELTPLAKNDIVLFTKTESTIMPLPETQTSTNLDPFAETALFAETEPAISETIASMPHEILHSSTEEREMFPDEQGQTAPIRAIPWWFRNTSVNPTGQEGPFTDQQSSRTDQRVERWLERWGRGEDEPQQREEQR